MAGRAYGIADVHRIILHADATRYLTMAGYTVLVWDHLCTIGDEIELLWTAPRSLVKFLFLVNRYITPLAQAVAIYYQSRLVVMSNIACRWMIMSIAAVGTWVLATCDLLLIWRVHALWGGRRSIVVGTYTLYFLTYTAHTVVGLLSAIELTPHLYYDAFAKTCVADHRPKILSFEWSFALFSETVVFVLTIIKLIEHRASNQLQNPLVESLFYGQLIYNTVIIAVRVFNIFIWNTLPASLTFLGVFFIWAMITAFVARMMLHLRKTACYNTQNSETSFFGETAVSTRMVWARHPAALDRSLTTFSRDAPPAVTNDHENVVGGNDREIGEEIALRTFWSGGGGTHGSPRHALQEPKPLPS